MRFCLICNYISRIDESLQTEFVRMRFNQLPEKDILKFLQKINQNENLQIKDDILISIQKHYFNYLDLVFIMIFNVFFLKNY